jgi:putative transcriptional regulator
VGGANMKNKIKEFRKKLAISQDYLAKRCDVSRQTINAIENDRYDPELKLAFKISKVFKKKVDDIFENEFLLVLIIRVTIAGEASYP